MIKEIPVITIDGPSGVGKGTLSKGIAKFLNWNFLDSGAIYRTLALLAIEHNINIKCESSLLSLIEKININFHYLNDEIRIYLLDKDITYDIRKEEISNIASYIAISPHIRDLLRIKQNNFLKSPGLIVDGRDSGTVVFPNAIIKIFLDANLEERSYRRMLQLKKQGVNVNFNDVLLKIKNRDHRDRNRHIAPLIPAKDAWILDSTKLSNKEVLNMVICYVQKKLKI